MVLVGIDFLVGEIWFLESLYVDFEEVWLRVVISVSEVCQ